MGLLGENFEDPKTLAILGAAASLLGSAGPRVGPRSMFGDIGQALQGGLQGYGAGLQFKNQAARQKLFEEQARLAQQKAEREMRGMGIFESMLGMGSPQGGPAPAMGGAPSGGPLPVQTQSLMPTDSGGEMGGIGPTAFGGAQQPMNMPQGQPPQGRAPMAGGLAAMTPEQIFALNGLTGKDATKLYELARQGIEFKPGSVYDMGGGRTFMVPSLEKGMVLGPNNQVSNAPGYVGANAEAKGAEAAATAGATEAAKARLDMMTIYNPQTRQMEMVPRLQAAMGGGPGAGGGFGGGGPIVAQPRQDDVKYQTERADTAAKTMATIQDAGRAAGSQIAGLRQIDRLLADHDGGNLSPLAMDIASAANSVGVILDKKLPNKEAAVNLSREMALQIINDGDTNMKGALSDGDRKFAMSLPPGIENSKEGRQKIVRIRTAMLERKRDVAEMARIWEKNLGRIDARDRNGLSFDDQVRRFSNENPLFDSDQQ